MTLQTITPRESTLAGDLKVRRALPFRARRMVGPFTFLDEMQPYTPSPDGNDGDVPPHPHIGLSTVTYLFEGEIMHRDSLGNVRAILPGDVNWMTAGKGIVHSERLSPEFRAKRSRLHGLQAWVALPLDREETEPSFRHYDAEELPRFHVGEVEVNLLAGAAFDRHSPVETSSALHYFSARFPASAKLDFDPGHHESAIYLLSGKLEVADQEVVGPALVLLEGGVRVRALEASTAVFLGGESIGPRYIDWNFVSSSRERLEQAKADWRAQRMARIPGETEFVPYPSP